MPDPQLSDIINQLQASFDPSKAAGIDADVQFRLSGQPAGDYYAGIHNQKIDLHPGTVASPKLTVTADTADLMNIFSGKLDPMSAFIQGKIKIAGDMSLAMKLVGLFKMK